MSKSQMRLHALVLTTLLIPSQSSPRLPDAEPVRLTLQCAEQAGLKFRFTVEGVGPLGTTLLIGYIVGINRWYVPSQVSFTVRRPGVANTNFDWFDPSVPGVVGGRLDPWIVQLPAGASFSVPIVIPKGFRDDFASPADVRVRLTASPLDNPVIGHVWSGTLTSPWIAFPADCRPQ